jgi:ABC-type transport system involved in multi-copper enzyme maturation permease subunit
MTEATESEQESPHIVPVWEVSLLRIWVLAQGTFVQLVRMKVFYFLLIFAVLVLVVAGAGIFWKPTEHLLAIKRWSFGAMYLFTMVYSIAATALLLPRDVEDRTLYTILSKPVPRIEYLIGRLLGVLMLNGIALAAMFLAMSVLVQWKMPSVEDQLVHELMLGAGGETVAASELNQAKEDAARFGVTGNLLWGVWALFLKASVVSAVTLFVSTIASSSLFTIVTSAMVVFIGHFHQLVIDYWKLNAAAGWFGALLARVLIIMFPNLGLFDVVDEVITGSSLSLSAGLQLTGMGLFYVMLFVLLAQLVFVDKEL